MKKICLLLIWVGLSTSLQAQVLSTRKDNAGIVTKYMRMQFGKDTIQTGVPFKAKDKPGMGISISKTRDKSYFTFDLRSLNQELLSDSIDMHKASLVFTMDNKDTVKIKTITKGRFDFRVDRTKESVMLFMHAYLTGDQLNILKMNSIATLNFYLDDHKFIILPVTNKEKRGFKNSVAYVLN